MPERVGVAAAQRNWERRKGNPGHNQPVYSYEKHDFA
jgi:hypothetical protein